VEILLVVAIALGLVVWVCLSLQPMLGQPHMRRLQRFHASLAADRRKVVICMGDSLTHGNASYDYVHELARRLEPSGYTVLNAGINSELAWNLLQRADAVVESEPAYVVVLVGTNDARGSESEWAARSYVRRMKLPQSPDEDFFRESYRALLDRLADSECTRMILVTLPPLGERNDEPVDAVLARFNAIIEQEATERDLSCLLLQTALREALAGGTANDPPAYDARRSERLVYQAVLQRHLLGWSWDRIAERNGMALLTDMIHLDERGGRILVDLVEAEIKGVASVDC
jgi:lysophospholipase L1-like esterase